MAFYKSLWPFSYTYYQEQIIKKEWYGQGDTPRHKCQPPQSKKGDKKVNKYITLFETKKKNKHVNKHVNKQPYLGLIGFLPYILLAYISSIGQEQINYRTGTDSSLHASKIGQFGRIIIFLNTPSPCITRFLLKQLPFRQILAYVHVGGGIPR